MKTQMIYEINNTYMEIDTDESEPADDYRRKMLEKNRIKNVLVPEIRMINNNRKLYVDISGKESLLSRFNSRLADRQEVKALMESIYLVVENASKYLIGESDIVLRPEFIFRNPVTKEYEFLIMPHKESEYKEVETKELLQFVMAHLDNSDEKLVSAIYGMHEMYQSDFTRFGVAFEFFTSEIKEELPDIIEEPATTDAYADNIILHVPRYIPSLSEIGALAMCFVGLVLIGFNVYLSMINV